MKRCVCAWPMLLCVSALSFFSCGRQPVSGNGSAAGGTSVTAAPASSAAPPTGVLSPAVGAEPSADGGAAPAQADSIRAVHLRGIMNDMRVNVRASASADGAVLGMAHRGNQFTVTGFSEETSVGGTAGRWVHVDLPCNDGDGWIFSPYIDVSEFPQYQKRVLPVADGIAVRSFEKDAERHGDYEGVTLALNLADGMFALDESSRYDAYRYKDQPFYSFWLRTAQGDVRTYIWYEGDTDVRYATSAIPSEGGPGGIISDDLNYLICDVGSAPGIRGVEVMDLNTGALIFRGAYHHDFEYEGNEITIVGTRMRETDAERKAAADRYDKEHPFTAEEQRAVAGGLTVSVIALYRYNFVTNEYRSLGLSRIVTQ